MTPTAVIANSISDRLSQATGLDPGALDASRLAWIIEARCRSLQLPDAPTYFVYLENHPAELDHLIDDVVIQETRFFRDATVFEHIRRAVPALVTAFPGALRILSAPCGTGQEAYSLAATLLETGLALSSFTIDAFDISLAALAAARNGLYPSSALAPATPELQRLCGALHGAHWKMHDSLRQRIFFERRNLADPAALGREPQYHLILCRNLFIYLHPQARATLAQSLAAALIPGGRLILGTADRVAELDQAFAPLKPAAAFAYTHRETPQPDPNELSSRRRSAVFTPGSTRLIAPPPTPEPFFPPNPVQTATHNAAELYLRAVHHFHRGELRKAERHCRQALYLEPTYLPALELLQTLWREQPNLRLRTALEARLERTRTDLFAAEDLTLPAHKETV